MELIIFLSFFGCLFAYALIWGLHELKKRQIHKG